jgi:hypothetical protein
MVTDLTGSAVSASVIIGTFSVAAAAEHTHLVADTPADEPKANAFASISGQHGRESS